MSDKKDKKVDEKSNPTHNVANSLIGDLNRVHIRLPKF